MSKDDLIKEISDQTKLAKKEASQALDAIFQVIEQSLSQGEDISLVGFGAFKVSKREERNGRNPRTGDSMTIPATKVVKFSPGKALKEAVNS
jgi:DNA-binding protein HU-beta